MAITKKKFDGLSDREKCEVLNDLQRDAIKTISGGLTASDRAKGDRLLTKVNKWREEWTAS